MAGPMDQVIAGYRDLTGQAPMYGKWAYGYWQSKEHYETRDELLGIARQYREKRIPIDNIIQDWNYWGGNENWGGMSFDETKYPQAQGDGGPASPAEFPRDDLHLAGAGPQHGRSTRTWTARVTCIRPVRLGRIQILRRLQSGGQ